MTDYKLVPVEPTERMLDAIRFRVGSIDRDEADEIYYLILSSSPTVQGEPVAWQRVDRPERIITKLSRRSMAEVDSGVEFIPLYATPQRSPDVAGLVEALEAVVFYHEGVEDNDGRLLMYYSKMMRKVREALADYRKQEST